MVFTTIKQVTSNQHPNSIHSVILSTAGNRGLPGKETIKPLRKYLHIKGDLGINSSYIVFPFLQIPYFVLFVVRQMEARMMIVYPCDKDFPFGKSAQ